MTIDVRIEGTEQECTRMVEEIEKICVIRSQSNFYPNGGATKEGRVYLKLDISDKSENTCVCCGEIIPEGRHVCPYCECGE